MRDHPALEIKKVDPGSPAGRLGLKPGFRLASVNGERLADEFDYRFAQAEDEAVLEYFDLEGRRHQARVEKDPDQDLGLEFAETPFRSCRVKCAFCFIDQNPKGMRPSIYFKDEDYRFSFLYGNYVTLFNMSEEDMAKAVERRMSPMYISVHATDEVLRSRLLGIKKPTHLLERIRRLAEANIEMHCQVVVCPGLNDGEVLRRTVHDLSMFHPRVASIACVPVGLTRHRAGLPDLRLSTPEEAAGFLDECGRWQEDFRRVLGTRLVFASDEWYLRCGRPLPPRGDYEDFPQLANGVGLISTFLEEFRRACRRLPARLPRPRRVTAATGTGFAPFLRDCAEKLCRRVAGLEVDVVGVRNDFFGDTIHVAGLLTGGDLGAALKGRDLGDELLLPHVMLRDREQVFLDDLPGRRLAETLGLPVRILRSEAADFVRACLRPSAGRGGVLVDEGPSSSADRELPEGMFAGSMLR